MCLTPTDMAMYCLKNTLHSFSFCCDYIFLKVMRASLGCWQKKCSLTFDRNVLDLSWMCCDASVVCSLWLIAPLIKALSPSDLCQDSPSLPPFLSSRHLSLSFLPHSLPVSLQSSIILIPALPPHLFCLPSISSSLSTFSSRPPVLHFPSPTACGVYFRGKSPSPVELRCSVWRIVN